MRRDERLASVDDLAAIRLERVGGVVEPDAENDPDKEIRHPVQREFHERIINRAAAFHEPAAKHAVVATVQFLPVPSHVPHVVGSNPKVAFMRREAASEMAGGPDGIAAEIAREARLNGTLIVLVGTKVGTWSNEISEERLARLVSEARASNTDGSSAELVGSLVRSVQTESVDSTPWGRLLAVIAALAIGSLLVLARVSRRSAVPQG